MTFMSLLLGMVAEGVYGKATDGGSKQPVTSL